MRGPSCLFSISRSPHVSIAIEHFPISAPAFDGRSRIVPAGNAFEWLRHGWLIFMVSPWRWMAVAVLQMIAALALANVGLIGSVVLCLFAPLLFSGALRASQKASSSERLDFSDFFSGVASRRNAMIILGLIMTASLAGLGVLFGADLVARLLGLLLVLPLVMCLWFAPALVLFNHMPPLEALKASFNACLKNSLSLLVYGLIVMLLVFFAALPVGLGFLVLMPVLSGSAYVSYRDIFVAN